MASSHAFDCIADDANKWGLKAARTVANRNIGGFRRLNVKDECDVADTAPLDKVSDEDVGGCDPKNGEVQADKELNPEGINMGYCYGLYPWPAHYKDDAINFDPNNNTDAPNTVDTTIVPVNDRKEIIAEIAALRGRRT
ncbi:hypothetical protein VDGL01_11130 [Verticillium dahliae]